MATTQIFHDYVMEQLSKIGDFSSRKMMGEYLIYTRGKMVAEICDNTLLLKPTDGILALLPNAPRQYPYEGSKTQMVVVEDIDDTALLRKIFETIYDQLPTKK